MFRGVHQVPAMKIFETSLKRGKFDAGRALPNGSLMEFDHIYPMDAVFDAPEDVPQEVKQFIPCQMWRRCAGGRE